MTNTINHSIKVNRALRKSVIGRYPGSALAMLDAIPLEIIDSLSSNKIAQLLDANWHLAKQSKALAAREAIEDGVAR